MICSKCGNDYSYKVWRVHRYRCTGPAELEVVEDESPVGMRARVELDQMSKNELLEFADRHGIDVDRRYGAHKLREVIADVDANRD